jgi:hypothetical protein
VDLGIFYLCKRGSADLWTVFSGFREVASEVGVTSAKDLGGPKENKHQTKGGFPAAPRLPAPSPLR